MRLAQDVLLAPIESSVIPLLYQIRALSRAISNNHVRQVLILSQAVPGDQGRYPLANEFGLCLSSSANWLYRYLRGRMRILS